MKYCSNCGIQISNSAKFCSNCGTILRTDNEEGSEKGNKIDDSILFTYNGITVNLQTLIIKYGANKINAVKELTRLTHLNASIAKKVIDEAYLGKLYILEDNEIKNKRNIGCITVFAWIFLLPIMAIITVSKSKKINKMMKVVIISIICIFCVAIYIASSNAAQQSADLKFNEIKIVASNKEYVKAQEELNNFLKDYPNYKKINEAQALLESVNPEADKIKAEQKAEADRIAAEKVAAEKAAEEKAAEEKAAYYAQFSWYNKDFGVINDSGSSDSFGFVTIKGRAIAFNKNYSYVQITYGIYSSSSVKEGNAYANVNNLAQDTTWQFSAIGTRSGSGNFNYKVEEVVGW
jgi:hypothetical protein